MNERADTRDAQAVSVYGVRHTDPAAFCDELARDVAYHRIEDQIVRLAITSGPATIEQTSPGAAFVAGGSRPNPWFRSRYVEASYIAGGQLVKLSAYCGVLWAASHAPPASAAAQTEETALRVSATLNHVQKAIHEIGEIEVRGGGLYVESPEPWIAHPLQEIALPPAPTCATCEEPVYYANGAWRHRSSRQAEATFDEPCARCGGSGEGARGRRCALCNGRKVAKRLDHVADPREAGRTE